MSSYVTVEAHPFRNGHCKQLRSVFWHCSVEIGQGSTPIFLQDRKNKTKTNCKRISRCFIDRINKGKRHCSSKHYGGPCQTLEFINPWTCDITCWKVLRPVIYSICKSAAPCM